jgi:LysM repeat protein
MYANTNRSLFSRWLYRRMGLLLVIALLAALLPVRASADSVAKLDCKRTYEVKRGDTLSSLGSLYGWATNQIVYVNKWKKPYTIYVGQRICIPKEKVSDLAKLDSKYAKARAVYFTVGGRRTSCWSTLQLPQTKVIIKADDASDSIRKFTICRCDKRRHSRHGKAWRFVAQAAAERQRAIYLPERHHHQLSVRLPSRGLNRNLAGAAAKARMSSRWSPVVIRILVPESVFNPTDLFGAPGGIVERTHLLTISPWVRAGLYIQHRDIHLVGELSKKEFLADTSPRNGKPGLPADQHPAEGIETCR